MSDKVIIENIRNSTREIIQYLGYLDNSFAHIGSISQCHALIKVEKKSYTIQELTTELMLKQSTISRLAQGLVNKGYCSYSINPTDLRSRSLKITALGKKQVQAIHLIASQQVQNALEKLSVQEKEIVMRGLTLYAQSLKNSHLGGKNNEFRKN